MSSRQKKTEKKSVHYSPTTKGGKSHGHRGSRDSAIGSSTASDRASLGTSPNASPFNSQEIQNQRHNPNALNEALDAANDRILQLGRAYTELSESLKEANKEIRLLKHERDDAWKEVSETRRQLDAEMRDNDKLRRESHSRSGSASSNMIVNPTAPRQKASRRPSTSQNNRPPPLVSQHAPNNVPNPFTPLPDRLGAQPSSPYERPAPQVSYGPSVTPSTVSYSTPSTVSYTSHTPPYSSSRPSSKRSSTSNSGNYEYHPI